MKDIIIDYLRNNYSIELRAENSDFSAKELKKYRDNLIAAITKYWDAPARNVGKYAILNKRVHEICSQIVNNNKFDIRRKTFCDNADIVVFWPAMPRV